MTDAAELYEDPEQLPDADEIDEAMAVRLMGDLRALVARRSLVGRTHRLAVEDMERRHLLKVGELDRRIAAYERALEAFARRAVPTLPKGRTYDLGYGTVRLTKPSSKGRVEVADSDAFAAWAKENPELPVVKVEHKPVAAELAKLARTPLEGEDGAFGLSLDGEPVPGVRVVVDTEDRFAYEFTTEEVTEP